MTDYSSHDPWADPFFKQIRNWNSPDGTIYKLVLEAAPDDAVDQGRVVEFVNQFTLALEKVAHVSDDFDLAKATDDAIATLAEVVDAAQEQGDPTNGENQGD